MPDKLLAEQAYDIIKAKIATMENDAHLNLRSLSNEIGIGYTPVREALLRLEREEYLKQIPRVGFFVRKMTEIEVLHYYQARECIEPFALRNAFDLINDSVIEKMKESFAIQENALKSYDFKTFLDADVAFHEIPFILLKNPHLHEFYKSLREKYRICSSTNYEYDRYLEIIKEHRQLIISIESGNQDESVTNLTRHLNESKTRIWKHIKM